MSQFAFLTAEFPEIAAHATKAERAALSDPRAACFYARLALEVAINWLYQHDTTLRNPFETTLAARIHEPSFQKLAGPAIVAKARIIKESGNAAAHETRGVDPATAVTAVRELFHLAYWLTRTYARNAKPAPGLAFTPQALPRTVNISAATLGQLREVARQSAERAEALQEQQQQRLADTTQRAALEAELAAARAEIAAIKAANTATPDLHDYDEAATRDAFIDLLLREAGWKLDKPQDREFLITGMPNASTRGFADYVLWADDAKPLGVVEAKRTKRDPHAGQQQAKLYADCLEQQFNQRPIIFTTNGYDHLLWDDLQHPPRPVQGFLTKDELQLAIQRRTLRTPLKSAEIDPEIVGRFYQSRAIRRVAEAFEKDHQRKALLVMATGSGKTRTVIALADLLMRANWAKRILFLADRRALVKQAVNAFKKHLPSSAPVNLATEKTGQGRVYVSTYPTMMNLIEETANGQRRFGVGHFDLVIIDEAHRSVYRKYGAIFDYFDSLLVGLTATPKNEVDRDTYRLFALQSGVPTDAYNLEEAVRDGFLVPPKAVSVPLKFIREGVRYADLTEEDKERWDAIEWDEDGTIPSQIDPPALNKWLFNTDTVDKVLQHLMTHGLHVADGERIGKTIVFAKNHDHAQFIVDRFDINYPHLKGSFARVIDHQTEHSHSLLDDFYQQDKSPHIAVSVDMLDTGIDVPQVVNLVFFKIVRSKAKFWQMIGRGTRLCPDLFGPGRHKEFFTVFDFCQNFEYFNQSPEAADAAIPDSLAKRLFAHRVELIGELDKHQADNPPLHRLRAETADRLHQEVAAMTLDNFIVRPKRRLVEHYANRTAWDHLDQHAQADLATHIAGLPSGLTDEDIDAKRFDLLVLRLQLAMLRDNAEFASLRRKLTDYAGLLEELPNVPMVAAHLSLIIGLQTEEFWQDITPPILDQVRRKLRGLIKLIEFKRRPIIYTDFADEIGNATPIEVSGIPIGTDMDRFRAKVRQFLEAHKNHLAITKLYRNEPLTPTDISELQWMLIEAGAGTPDSAEQINAGGGLGMFIRSLIGLERAAAKHAFADFIQGRACTAQQIDFIDMIIDHLTARGAMDPRLLYQSPFTDLDPLGVAGIFNETEVSRLVGILQDVTEKAAA